MKTTLIALMIAVLHTPTLAHAYTRRPDTLKTYNCAEAKVLDRRGYTAVFVEKGIRLSIRALEAKSNPKLRIEKYVGDSRKISKGRAMIRQGEGSAGHIKSKGANLDLSFVVLPYFKEVSTGQEFQYTSNEDRGSDDDTVYLCDQDITDLFVFEECR